jgi:alkaline phosphatase D
VSNLSDGPDALEQLDALVRRLAIRLARLRHDQPQLLLGPDAHNPANMHLYDQLSWGKLADVWTLDCRQYRSAQACRDPVRGGGRRPRLRPTFWARF